MQRIHIRLRRRWRLRLLGTAFAAGEEERRHQALRTVIHDLRNPLNGILLNAQFLEEVDPSPEAARIARRIQKQALEMNALLERFANRECSL